MKRNIFLAALAALMLFPAKSFAQLDEREPGIYAIVEDESIPLASFVAGAASSSTNVIGIEIGNTQYNFKGEESGVVANGKFVMVIDPEKTMAVKSLKKFNPFIKTMTPNNVIIIPLKVNEKKHRREYSMGQTFMGINTEKKERVPFEWEQISDNSYEITLQDVVPGEYGFVFKYVKLSDYDFGAIFGFTIAGGQE